MMMMYLVITGHRWHTRKIPSPKNPGDKNPQIFKKYPIPGDEKRANQIALIGCLLNETITTLTNDFRSKATNLGLTMRFNRIVNVLYSTVLTVRLG